MKKRKEKIAPLSLCRWSDLRDCLEQGPGGLECCDRCGREEFLEHTQQYLAASDLERRSVGTYVPGWYVDWDGLICPLPEPDPLMDAFDTFHDNFPDAVPDRGSDDIPF